MNNADFKAKIAAIVRDRAGDDEAYLQYDPKTRSPLCRPPGSAPTPSEAEFLRREKVATS